MDDIKYSLVALYLKGLSRPADPPKRAWPLVVGALRRSNPLGVLQEAGFSLEAMLLSDAVLLAEACRLVHSGSVLTACCPEYPSRWLAVLGAAAPPVLWRAGASCEYRELVAIVGSRHVEPRVLRFCQESGLAAVSAGYGLISGGAQGCDQAAVSCARDNAIELWAYGVRMAKPTGMTLSLAAPNEPFSTGLAMERNALIYAAGRVALVGHVRHMQGGSWHGAVAAIRRKLAPLAVRADGSAAASSLVALGARPLHSPEEFLEFAEGQGEPLQPSLSFAV